MPQTAAHPSLAKHESIATRHARLYDRREKHSVSERVTRVAVSLLVVGTVAISLWLVAG